MIVNSVKMSPKKSSDEPNTIDKWLLGIRKEVLVLPCQISARKTINHLKEDNGYLQNITGEK